MRFNICKKDFLNLSPKDFAILNKLWNDDKLLFIRNDWERTRLQIYFGLQLKRPVSYKQFCIEHFPLQWDEESEPFEINEELRKQVFEDLKPSQDVQVVTDLSELKGLI